MLPERFLPMGYSFQVFFDLGVADGLTDKSSSIRDNRLSVLERVANVGSTVANAALAVQNISKNVFDTQFQSVSGLSVDYSTVTIKEGGENSLNHDLPGRANFSNLVLTRGLAPSSALTQWVQEATENHNFMPAQVLVLLRGPDLDPMHAWYVNHAYPVKWSIDAFNAEESKIVIETLELKYNHFRSLNAKELQYDFATLSGDVVRDIGRNIRNQQQNI